MLKNNYKKILIFFIISFYNFYVFAACINIKDIKWPEELIYFYFHTPGTKIITLPYNFCAPSGRIEILNSNNELAGSFNVTNSVFSWYNNLTVKSAKTNPMVKKYHDNVSKLTDPLDMADFLLKTFNSSLKENSNKNLLFVEGKFQPNRTFAWNPYKGSGSHWFAKNISYEVLLNLYSNTSTEFVGFAKDSFFSFPKTKVNQMSTPKYYRYDIKTLVDKNTSPSMTSNDKIVVISTEQSAIEAYNYISELSLTKKTPVYWFNYANLKWIQVAKKNKLNKLSGLTLITAPELFKSILSNTEHLVLDIRDKNDYDLLRFKKSKYLSVNFKNSAELRAFYANNGQIENYNKLPESKKKAGDYILPSLNQISKSSKIYLVADYENNPWKLKSTLKQFQKQGYKNVALIKEPIGDLIFFAQLKNINKTQIFFEASPSFNSLPAF